MAEKQRILIVDDDNNIAELISLYLTNWGQDSRRSPAVISSLPCRQLPRLTSRAITWNIPI